MGEEEIASLNAQYRGLENATNVLSFPAGISVEEVEFLGDIVICSKVVKLESDLYGRGFADRYVHMLIHGLLHLLGYDHMEERSANPDGTVGDRLVVEARHGQPL